ncbi:Copper chaperone OS=Streptomyces alboniger OX=132473 GN=CP975_12330 PE=4 SV=1 [Streptomyces alboniger]
MSSSCCSTDGNCSTGTADQTTATATGTATATATATEAATTTYAVSGMTCGHCKATLTKVIGDVDGVTGVDVDLDTGRVTVTSAAEPDDAVIAEVVDEAGYQLTGRA